MEGGEAPARGSAPGDDAATGFALAGAPARQRRKTALLVTDEDAAPQIKRQAVLGVNAGGLHVAEDAAPAPAPRIIPAQPDTFRCVSEGRGARQGQGRDEDLPREARRAAGLGTQTPGGGANAHAPDAKRRARGERLAVPDAPSPPSRRG